MLRCLAVRPLELVLLAARLAMHVLIEQLAFCHGRWRCHDQILPSSILLELVQLLLDRRQSVRGLPCSLLLLYNDPGFVGRESMCVCAF